jgi:CMP-N,N'-diacetyllegionaminic acid synthase
MQTLGIILARAGSLGLVNKHLLPLLGKPVISYTFDHARASRRLDRVVVTSDCPKILKLARQSGFDTIVRPEHLATSDASVQSAMLHAMRAVEADESFQSDAVVCLYGNVPVRGAGVIDHAIDLLEETGCDSVRSFCPVGKWHPGWMCRLEGDHVSALRPGSIHRRQDLEPLFLHDGAVVAVSRASMLLADDHPGDGHAFFGVDRRAVQTGMGDTVEIDHQRDLYWAEAVLRSQAPVLRMVV